MNKIIMSMMSKELYFIIKIVMMLVHKLTGIENDGNVAIDIPYQTCTV